MPIKKETLAKYMNPVLIETGTFLGATIEAGLKLGFQKIFSIEIDEKLYYKACKKFDNQPSVELLYGDTLEWLPKILSHLDNCATFWLDAHRSGELPGGKIAYPIVGELEIIANHYIKNHTILIDDRRLLKNPWSITEDDVQKALFNINPQYNISYEPGVIEYDIIVAKLPETSKLKNTPQALVEVHVNQGDLFAQKQQWNQAISAYHQAIKIDPNFPWSYHKLGGALVQLKRWDEAVDAYRQVIAIEPNFPWSYNKLGDALMELKIWQEAINVYRHFIEIKPDFPWSYKKLGKAFMELKIWQEAVTAYRHFITLKPDLYLPYKNLGDALIQLENWSEAVAAYRQAVEINPDFYQLYAELGEKLIKLEKWLEAVEIYQNAIEINPNNYWYHNNLGKALFKLDRYEKATAAYQRAIEIDPNLYFAYQNLGAVLVKLKKWNQAIVAYRRAIKIKPDFYWSHHNLGQILTGLKRWDEAVETYRYAIENDPNSPWYYQHLGIALRKQGNIEEAIACYRKAIELKSDWHRFYSLLGDVLLEKGQSEEAIACYIKAIKLQPDATATYEQLRGIYIFKLAQFTPNQLNELVKYYREAIQLKPDFPEAYINLADLLTEDGQLNEAINCYKKATHKKLLISHPEYTKNYWELAQTTAPHFIIIGTVKGGTSSLYSYINQHPYVIPALQKEINFFDRNFTHGINWYLAHFPLLHQQKKFITGEASPNYMYSNIAGKRLFNNFPKIKIIAILRHPVDRTVSHFYMAKKLGKESNKFTEFLPQDIQLLTKLNNNPQNYERLINRMSVYFTGSLYKYFLEKWMNLFPREQFLILKSEDMYKNPAATMKQVFNFLELPDYQLPNYINYYPGSYTPIKPNLHQQLSELFQPHNQKLEEYLGMKLDWQ
ncbi:MAG: tetratricopeptide repeat protein [Cyanobacteria bacterium P01_H01_bin.35]